VELEAARVAVVDRHADDVRRQHVGRALDAVEVQAEQFGQDMGQDGLADARQILDQQMAARKQADQGEADLALLAEHDAAGMANGFDLSGNRA
jgi:hypothetical protein